MTTLILAQKRIISFLPCINITRWSDKFQGSLVAKLPIRLLLGVICVSISTYLAALFFAFNLSFHIRENNKKLAKLENSALITELKFQETSAGIIKDKSILLQSMEEVSSIKYLSSEDLAVSYR